MTADLKGTGQDSVNWIHLTQDRDQWWALMTTVMNLWVPLNPGNLTEQLLASQEGLCPI
jgi:hypothetical protein